MAAPKPVIIAGGGPVGLIVALILGRAGVKVTLFDSGSIVYSHPRAATIHAATLDILDDLGVYERIEPQGVICPFVNYYDGKELLASFDYGLIKDEVRHPWVLQCEQDKLSRTVFAMVQQQPSVEVRTETPVIGCSQSADHVEVVVQQPGGAEERHRAAYLVAADGARSIIRKEIGVEFEGFTYPEKFMIIGTPYDFSDDGYAYRNYISDPDEWYNLFKISWTGPPGVFRLVAPVRPDEAAEGDEGRATAQRKLQRFNPRHEPYEIVIYDPYVVSQRVAATFRAGRVLLAGDFGASQQSDRRHGHEQRHPRRREPRAQHAARARRRERRRARPLRAPAPPRRHRARADRDHRQQEEHGAARPAAAHALSR